LGEYLLPSKQFETSIDRDITDVIRKNNPKTIREVVKLLQPKYRIPEQKILEHILRLQDQGKIVLKEHPSAHASPLLKNYILSTKASWYWTVIAVAVATMALVFTVPENAYPIVYTRYMLGSISVLFLPGYSLIKALFPTHELDNIERIALSIGMSLALVPITGLFLNYTPWDLRVAPVLLSLLTLTIIFATVAVVQEYQTKMRNVT